MCDPGHRRPVRQFAITVFMKNVSCRSEILKASDELKVRLESAGTKEQVAPSRVLFREEDESAGVYLVCRGKVRLSVRNVPELDRDFSTGCVLGLPSSFTGRPYSLTAVTLTEAEVAHVSRDKFLKLMRDEPDLCREATDILGREVTFIHSALAEQHRRLATAS